jgi:hypothetical protein
VTFEDADFDPGFTTWLVDDQTHVLHVALFSGNAETATRSLVIPEDADLTAGGLRFDQ